MKLYTVEKREGEGWTQVYSSSNIQLCLTKAREIVESDPSDEIDLARIKDSKGSIYWRPAHDLNACFN